MADYFPGKRRESWIPERIVVVDKAGKLLPPEQIQRALDQQFESLQRLAALVLGEGPGVGEVHDITFSPGVAVAVRHKLHRIPSGFSLTYIDNTGLVTADPTSGWGDKVVYFIATKTCNARIKLY